MSEKERKYGDENFSDDPEENLRIENEILKLKMQAERDAVFGGNEDLPAEVEAEFLKNVQMFEDSFDKAREVTVYECIGKPSFKKIDELKPEEAEKDLKKIMELMQSKNIILDMQGQYELSVIYKFITEELFQEQIREVNFPGYVHRFIYEEFYPNHDIEIGNTAQVFLNHWFEKGFDEDSTEFSSQLVTAEGGIFSREEVIAKLCNCLNSYHSFSNIKFKGSETSFEWNDEEKKARPDGPVGRGMGHAEGIFSYDADIESGETIHIEGPFKLYMINETGWWQIFYFVFPGFGW
jgi:hypothetical protein